MSKAQQKLRVLFVSHAPRLEGAEQSLLQLAEELERTGNVQPMIIIPKSGKLQEYLEDHEMPYIRAWRYPWWVDWTATKRLLLGPLKFAWNLFSWAIVKERVKSFNPDVVYINTLVVPFGWIIARDLNRPFVWHMREFVPEWLDRDYDFGRSWSLGLVAQSNAIVANSYAVMNSVREDIPADRVHVVYNGIECPPFQHLLVREKAEKLADISQPIHMLVVGSVNANKDQASVVRSLHHLLRCGFSAHLSIVGEFKNNYGELLNNLIDTLGLRSNVHIAGWQSGTGDFYRKADVTVVASRGEPFGRTIIESLSYGTPVVATDSGGATEIMERLDKSLLYPVGDHEALANRITRLVKNPEYYQAIARNGHALIEREFSVQRHVEKMWQIFQLAVNQRRC